jgi:hypothetical protein
MLLMNLSNPTLIGVHELTNLGIVVVVDVHKDVHGKGSISSPVVVITSSGGVVIGSCNDGSTSLNVEVLYVHIISFLVKLSGETGVGGGENNIRARVRCVFFEAPWGSIRLFLSGFPAAAAILALLFITNCTVLSEDNFITDWVDRGRWSRGQVILLVTPWNVI